MMKHNISSRKNKLCILSSAHDALDIRIFHRQAKSLANAGYDVCLIAQHPNTEIIERVKIIGLPRPKNRIYRIVLFPIKIMIIGLRQNANIYHFHDPELIFVGLFLKLFGKKVVYDVHEDFPKSILAREYLPSFARKILSTIVRSIEAVSTRFFNLVVCATDNISKQFRRSCVIRNFPITYGKRAHNKINSNGFNLVYPGPIGIERGITQILKALELLKRKDIRLLLMGNFCDAGYEEYVTSLTAWKQVEFIGNVTHEIVIENLMEADLGVECSLPEPNYLYAESNKIFEYMSVGLPVLCSDLPRLKEIVEGNECGICVNPQDHKEIAKAIEYLMENPNLRRQMGENGWRAVKEKYCWAKEREKLIKFYDEISQ